MRPDGLTPENFPLLDEFAIPEGGVCGAFSSEAALNPTDEPLEKQAELDSAPEGDIEQTVRAMSDEDIIVLFDLYGVTPLMGTSEELQERLLRAIEQGTVDKGMVQKGASGVELCQQDNPKRQVGQENMEQQELTVETTDANHPTHASVKSAQRKTVEWDDDDIQSIERAEQEKAKLENDGYSLVDTVQLGLSKWRLIYEMEKTADGTTYKDEQYGGQGLPKYVRSSENGDVFGVIVYENGDVALSREPDGPPWLFASVADMKRYMAEGNFISLDDTPGMETVGNAGGGLESNDVVAPEGLPTKAEDEQGGQDMQNRENVLSMQFPNFNDLPENERFLMRMAVMVDNDIAETPVDVLRDALDTINNRRSDAEPTEEEQGYKTKIIEELKNRGLEAGRRPFKWAGVDESVYQGFLNAMRGTGAQSMQEEFDVMARQMGLGGQQITEIAERLTADGFEVSAGRRPFEKKAVTRKDLSDQVLDKSRADESLYCPICDEWFSASSGDYFMMRPDQEFVCDICGNPLVLANKYGGRRPFRVGRGEGVKQASINEQPVPGFDLFIWEDEDEDTALPKLIRVTEVFGNGIMMMGGQRVRFELLREVDDPVGEATGKVFKAYRVASVKNAEEDGPAWGDHAQNMKDTEAWERGYSDAQYQQFSYVPENAMEYIKGYGAYFDEHPEVPRPTPRKAAQETGGEAALYYYPELIAYIEQTIGGDLWGMSGYGDPQSEKRVVHFKLHPREWESRFGGDDYYVVIYQFSKIWNLQNSQGEMLVEGNGSPEDPGNMERIGKWFGKF